jgi:hypothetical protein
MTEAILTTAMNNIETTLSPDGSTIRIFIPARLGRHAGRKTILSPEGGPVNRDRTESFDATLVNALVRAHKWNRWLDQGNYADIKELAAAEGITSPNYASRILRLVLLAPDIQEAILFGEQPAGLTLSQLMDGATTPACRIGVLSVIGTITDWEIETCRHPKV